MENEENIVIKEDKRGGNVVARTAGDDVTEEIKAIPKKKRGNPALVKGCKPINPMLIKGDPENDRGYLIGKIISKKDKLIDSQIDSAIGLYYETADGKHIYKKKPDTTLGQYLLNQWIGKPKESIEVKSINVLKIDI